LIGSVSQQGVAKVTLDGQVSGRAVKSWRNLFKDAYLAEMEHFVECVEQDKPSMVTGNDGRKAVEMVLAVNKSLRCGTPVAVAEDAAS
jgi:predicted dehydrogenase